MWLISTRSKCRFLVRLFPVREKFASMITQIKDYIFTNNSLHFYILYRPQICRRLWPREVIIHPWIESSSFSEQWTLQVAGFGYGRRIHQNYFWRIRFSFNSEYQIWCKPANSEHQRNAQREGSDTCVRLCAALILWNWFAFCSSNAVWNGYWRTSEKPPHQNGSHTSLLYRQQTDRALFTTQ
jgi:hypothetical protein